MQVRRKMPPHEAMQYTGDNLLEVLTFTGRHPSFNKWFKDDIEYTEYVRKDGNVFKIIGGLLGTQRVSPEMWVIKCTSGECFALEDHIFKRDYEVIWR